MIPECIIIFPFDVHNSKGIIQCICKYITNVGINKLVWSKLLISNLLRILNIQFIQYTDLYAVPACYANIYIDYFIWFIDTLETKSKAITLSLSDRNERINRISGQIKMYSTKSYSEKGEYMVLQKRQRYDEKMQYTVNIMKICEKENGSSVSCFHIQ